MLVNLPYKPKGQFVKYQGKRYRVKSHGLHIGQNVCTTLLIPAPTKSQAVRSDRPGWS